VLKGTIAAIDWASANRSAAEAAVNDGIQKLTHQTLSQAVLDRAFDEITLSADPDSKTFPQLAQDSVTAGVVKTAANLKGFLDLRPLNAVLSQQHKPTIDAAGLESQ
jgi:NitT/TauT family transport system substrate-binding protein